MAPNGGRNEKKANILAKFTTTTAANPDANVTKLASDLASQHSSGSDSMAADMAKIYNLLHKVSRD